MSLVSLLKVFSLPTGAQRVKRFERIYRQNDFLQILQRERARSERSIHLFSLVVFKIEFGKQNDFVEKQLLEELSDRMRVTDVAGWLGPKRVGAILHNATAHEGWSFARNIKTSLLSAGINMRCEVHSYPPPQKKTDENVAPPPEDLEPETNSEEQFVRSGDASCLQTLYTKKMTKKKRCLDLLGSIVGLLILSPVFFLVWLTIKFVSPGPAIYRQTRIGKGV